MIGIICIVLIAIILVLLKAAVKETDFHEPKNN
jgi:hypothetical protein